MQVPVLVHIQLPLLLHIRTPLPRLLLPLLRFLRFLQHLLPFYLFLLPFYLFLLPLPFSSLGSLAGVCLFDFIVYIFEYDRQRHLGKESKKWKRKKEKKKEKKKRKKGRIILFFSACVGVTSRFVAVGEYTNKKG
jgi:hypothetical protein